MFIVILLVGAFWILFYFSETKIHICFMWNSSTLAWHSSRDPCSLKSSPYPQYIVNIRTADDLASQGARASVDLILTYTVFPKNCLSGVWLIWYIFRVLFWYKDYLSQVWDSHDKYKTVMRLSYPYLGNSYNSKTLISISGRPPAC